MSENRSENRRRQVINADRVIINADEVIIIETNDKRRHHRRDFDDVGGVEDRRRNHDHEEGPQENERRRMFPWYFLRNNMGVLKLWNTFFDCIQNLLPCSEIFSRIGQECV
ncbi:hypothetical protein V7138_16995 [Bacillus sp. JJ1533]|uniref:hypothetical protein n=1 Tax=Bacillus sp. JJ1533 TaxID=3122959 RepID=UPI002FFDBAB2